MGCKRKTYESIIENIWTRKRLIRKHDNGLGNLYKVTLSRVECVQGYYKNYEMSFEYRDSMFNDSKLEQYLLALFVDRDVYKGCKSIENIYYTFEDMTYEDAQDLYRRIFAEVKQINKFFSRRERKIIEDHFFKQED